MLSYGSDDCHEQEVKSVEQLAAMRTEGRGLWVDVQGVGDAEMIGQIGDLFGFHMLSLEDVLNLHQRPKVEAFDHYIYCVLRMPEFGVPLRLEQMSVFFGKDFVVTFQEDPGDPLDPVRERLRHNRGKIRGYGPDYLAYAIIDAIVDHYFPVLESFADRIDELEEDVLSASTPNVLSMLQDIRRDLLLLRRAVWPLREMIGTLARDECEVLVSDKIRPYLRDCQDHAAQLTDVLENCRELSTALMDAYISSVALRTNEVMRVLTIMSTIFIPLTFIAGIYGMNFDPSTSPLNMPELQWYLGYPFALATMAITAVVLVFFFRRKGWLGTTKPLTRR
ncbi:MAG: magnesium/cobalt transporter CorA [Myxococcales bacterium]